MPLPVPQAVWTDIGLDFVEALPRVGGKSVILTVVDRFSKYCHFIALAHPYSAESVARAFFTDIVRLHGVPQSMVSDRDPVFTSTFWRELMRLMGTRLHIREELHLGLRGGRHAPQRRAPRIRLLLGMHRGGSMAELRREVEEQQRVVGLKEEAMEQEGRWRKEKKTTAAPTNYP
ncbi:hypothetical protein E2562_029664 [Oryza meyeriana var. granulata]|uniref:Integrase catalytic domain-containing protein n=2 Tax=Oryza meyeriana var. granulata TaxID=110450 RepID=A0A6G1C027_9ORYZ|nr:hypothetical protein E2562_029664 [Oryza meyeriana var. granulata]